MSIIKVHKTGNYTVMSNHHLRNKDMSLKAKGLLSLMLSLPNDWDYSIAGLVKICKENETSVKSTLAELKEFSYLDVIKVMPDKSETGRIEYIYNIYEMPKQEHKKQEVENLPLENLPLENLPLENQGQLNTNILNTKELNTKNNNKKKSYKKKSFEKPTLEEITEYCKERNNNVNPKKFYDYYNSNDWKDKNGNVVKSWKQKMIANWEKEVKKREMLDNERTNRIRDISESSTNTGT